MRRTTPRSAGPRIGRRAAARDRTAEQRRFLEAIAPASHFHRVFDGLDDVLFFARNLEGELLFFSRGGSPSDGPSPAVSAAAADGIPDRRTGPSVEHRTTDRVVIESRKPLVGHVEMLIDEVGLPEWYESNRYPIFDRKGDVIGVMGTLRRCHGAVPGGGLGRIAPALAILGDELQRFPALERLAASCHMSPRNLQRAFRDVFGFGPRTYWMRCRIRAACSALRAGGRSQVDVALALGFCDQSSFSQHFHRQMGVSPSAYLKGATAGKGGGV